jgi:hypothetical protein
MTKRISNLQHVGFVFIVVPPKRTQDLSDQPLLLGVSHSTLSGFRISRFIARQAIRSLRVDIYCSANEEGVKQE